MTLLECSVCLRQCVRPFSVYATFLASKSALISYTTCCHSSPFILLRSFNNRLKGQEQTARKHTTSSTTLASPGGSKTTAETLQAVSKSPVATNQHTAQQGVMQQNAISQQFDKTNPDSVGLPFTAAPVPIEKFRRMIASSRYHNLRLMGIRNRENHCYRNAVLVAFLSIPRVMNYLIGWHSDKANRERRSARTSVLSKLVQILVALFLSDTPQADIDRMVEEFWNSFCYEKDDRGQNVVYPSSTSWRRYQSDEDGTKEDDQQDARDFLGWMLGKISSQLASRRQSGSGNEPLQRFKWALETRLAVRAICRKCQFSVGRRIKVEDQTCLMLHIPSSSPDCVAEAPNLSDLIDSVMQTEAEGECSRCKKRSHCRQEQRLQHAPPLLMLVVNRAKYDEESRSMWKDSTAVVIDQQLDMTRHLNEHEFGPGSRVTYSLTSVVSHSGDEVDSGHYVSYVRGGERRQTSWFEIDDDRVQEVQVSEFDDSQTAQLDDDSFWSRFTPYILFYQRNLSTDPAPAPGREARNVNEGADQDEQPSYWTGNKHELTSKEHQ